MNLKQSLRTTKPTKTLSKKSVSQDYASGIAMGLLIYSQRNKKFRDYLNNRLQNFSGKQLPLKQLSYSLTYKPNSYESATQKMEWLITKAIIDNDSNASQALQSLAASVRDCPFTSPKQIVIGLVGLAIPGITLGKISNKITMNIYIDKNQKNKTTAIKNAVRASHQTLTNALLQAKGDINKLEPDIADWFFGEKKTKIHQVSTEELNTLEKKLNQLKAIFGKTITKDKVSAIAVSPSIDNAELLF